MTGFELKPVIRDLEQLDYNDSSREKGNQFMVNESSCPESKLEAQQRIDQIRAFEAELKIVESENIISLDESQYSRIKNFHEAFISQMANSFGIDSSQREKQLSLG